MVVEVGQMFYTMSGRGNVWGICAGKYAKDKRPDPENECPVCLYCSDLFIQTYSAFQAENMILPPFLHTADCWYFPN